MKIRITQGPNAAGWMVIAATGAYSWSTGSIYPVLILVGLAGYCVLLSLMLMKWNAEEERKLAEDFPHDPYIQRKYGNLRKNFS